MKSLSQLDEFAAEALKHPHWLNVFAAPVEAISYCRAAQRDEKNGYGLTAAMEWHKAAELMAPVPAAADFCWMQWERIMCLPRRLAQPIEAPPPTASNTPAAPAATPSFSHGDLAAVAQCG